jgi:hypothetical protein
MNRTRQPQNVENIRYTAEEKETELEAVKAEKNPSRRSHKITRKTTSKLAVN